MASSDVDPESIPLHLAIVGGGIAGCAAASWASSHGARVSLINAGMPLGGACIHAESFPARLLMNAATDHYRAGRPRFPGIRTSTASPNWSELTAHRRSMADEISRDTHRMLTEQKKVELIVGYASFVDQQTLRVGEELIRPDRILLTPGSPSEMPDIDGLDDIDVLDLPRLLDSDRLPKRLLFFGTTPSSVAYAQMMTRLGSNVTILADTSFLSGEDYSRKITSALSEILIEDGIEIIEDSTITHTEKRDGYIRAFGTCKDHPCHWDADSLVLANHHRPRTSELHPHRAGIELNDQGLIVIDETLQTTNPMVFAAGDAIGGGVHAYAAAYDAVLAAKNAISRSRTAGATTAIPFAIYTDPQVAGVGWDEQQAAQAGFHTETTTINLSQIPASRALGYHRGFVQLCRDSRSDHLLGARILAPNASELIMEAALAIRSGLTVSELATLIHPPISMGDAIARAAALFHSS